MEQDLRIPIIRVMGCLVVSIQMALHDDLLEQLLVDLGEAVERERPRGVVIELAHVGIIDSFTTRIINNIGLTARLMGARTIVAGIQPAVAMTMVEMGIELRGIETVLSVDDALERLGFRIDAESALQEESPGEADVATTDDGARPFADSFFHNA